MAPASSSAPRPCRCGCREFSAAAPAACCLARWSATTSAPARAELALTPSQLNCASLIVRLWPLHCAARSAAPLLRRRPVPPTRRRGRELWRRLHPTNAPLCMPAVRAGSRQLGGSSSRLPSDRVLSPARSLLAAWRAAASGPWSHGCCAASCCSTSSAPLASSPMPSSCRTRPRPRCRCECWQASPRS